MTRLQDRLVTEKIADWLSDSTITIAKWDGNIAGKQIIILKFNLELDQRYGKKNSKSLGKLKRNC